MTCRRSQPALLLALLALAPIAHAHSNGAEQYLIAAANQERAAQGIAPLQPDPALSATARNHAANIDQEALLLFNAANRERAQQNAPPLRWDPALAQAAANHAAQMASRGTISHQFAGEPDLSTRGSSAGAHFSLISENVAEAPSAARIHAAWMQSQGHRENILDPRVDAVGIAVVVRNGQRYAVQDFARTTQSFTLEQQEATVGALLDSAGLTLLPDARDARATCATTAGFHGGTQPGFIMRYTTASLDALPDQLAPRLTTGNYHQASVGACTQSGKGPFSTYRIAILLYP
jgi:uncharacterized protein YkwD